MTNEHKGVDWEEVQSGNWNVAKPYTSEKILRWLVLIDEYQTIATFGYSKLESDVYIRDKNLQNTARLHALKRLLHSISSLMRNTKFAIMKGDKEKFDEYSERIQKIHNHLGKLRLEKKRGNRVLEIYINEDLFEKIMDELNKMIDDIHDRLNKADLIFTHTEDYDPRKIKEGLKERYINKT